MPRVAIGLGSNLGDRAATLRSAGEAIGLRIGSVAASSALWETAPVGGPDQGPYLNAVVLVDTDVPPRGVLDRLLEIEQAHGRERREKWGPRTLDLDLLLYGDQQIDSPGLTVPHPRLTERRFVLEPLMEVWPGAKLPDGTPLNAFVADVAGQDVTRWEAASARSTSVVVFLAAGLLAVLLWLLIDQILG